MKETVEKLYEGVLLKKDGTAMLKAYLQVKHQLAYCKTQAEKAKGNEEAYAGWMGMVEAYSITLQIMEGKEI